LVVLSRGFPPVGVSNRVHDHTLGKLLLVWCLVILTLVQEKCPFMGSFEMQWAGVESSCLYWLKNWLVRQLPAVYKGFFFFIWSFLLGTGVRSQGRSGLLTFCKNTLCWGGESGVKMEWSFNMSLQEHIHSPVKASCLLALWHFEASPGGHDL
jgi:hypothetical protein